MSRFLRSHIDWTLFICTIPLVAAGLITMRSFSGETDFFTRQLVWFVISIVVFFVLSHIDFRFLRRTNVLILLYSLFVGLLVILMLINVSVHGARSWFDLGPFSFQPVDFMKLILILMLAKYFSRRHVEIKRTKHIIISGLYTAVPFLLVFLQPDLGSAIIMFLIWLGMALVSGISRKHLIVIVLVIASIGFIGWHGFLEPYQKARIVSFIHPLADIHDTGYNAYQSTIAVGSGELLGKGVGYGTQSRLHFLPEYETDFIFAAFSEEWGFVGSLIVLALFAFLIFRILHNAQFGATNFEALFAVGVAILFIGHIIVHVAMNIGLLPVTGLPLPFMSYGGSHLLMEFVALGILSGMRRYARHIHRSDLPHEFVGPRMVA